MIRLELYAGAHEQGAGALGSVDLVAREAQEIDVPVIDINRNSPRRLGRIGVEERTGALAPSRDFRDGLEHPDLVVGGHHRDYERLFVEHLVEMIEVQEAVCIDGQYDGVEARASQVQDRLEHRRVFGRQRHDPIALAVARMIRDSSKGQVAGFGGTGCKHDLVIVRVDQGCHARPCVLDRARRLPTEAVIDRVGIAEQISQKRQHCLAHRGIDWGCGLIVQVDGRPGHSVQSHGSSDSLSAPMSRPAARSL